MVAVLAEHSPFGLELIWEIATPVTILDEGNVIKVRLVILNAVKNPCPLQF
jgi:hypothetical protein